MPDYTKQYDFIKYWMFTSQLGPIAAPSTFDVHFAVVTAEFGLDALTLEQVHVFTHTITIFQNSYNLIPGPGEGQYEQSKVDGLENHNETSQHRN